MFYLVRLWLRLHFLPKAVDLVQFTGIFFQSHPLTDIVLNMIKSYFFKSLFWFVYLFSIKVYRLIIYLNAEFSFINVLARNC